MSLWNITRQSQPGPDDYVQFIVTGHTAWLFGNYEGGCFRSRWASYRAADVSMWRKLDEEPQHPPPRPITPDRLYWSERRLRG